MKQQYFILVLAHSLHGKLRRVQIPQRVIYVILALAAVGVFTVLGAVTSYARMAWKVANYNSLRQEITSLRARYQKLQSETKQTNDQLANLQLFASEISMAYGLKQKLEGPADISSEGRLIPTIQQSIQEYDLLRTANITSYYHRYSRPWLINTRPSIWPVDGRLQGAFGRRTDPFSGEGAIHTGVDITAPIGTPVRAAADGVVVHAQVMSGYGRLVVIDHGNEYQTYYAHLSSFEVIPGQEIRQGEVIGAVGASGRVTAPHLHYEVRRHGSPENPARYLGSTRIAQAAKRDFPF
ncbi:MAG: M23 family metallopeptidase [Bryobacteraceae bacterium]|jgi:murein DD-endopeptidase MepM/ murein hydrolase activator NlpD